jgi:hypothetical protein
VVFSSGSSAIGRASSPSSWATVSAAANAAGRRAPAAPSTQLPELVDQRLGDVRVGQGQHPHHDRHGDLLAVDRVGSELVEPRREHVRTGGRVGDQHGPGDPLLLVEPRLVHLLGPPGELAQDGDVAVLGRPAHLLEAAGAAVVPQDVGAGGVDREMVGPVLLGQDVEARHADPCTSSPSSSVVSSRICTLRIFPVTVIGNSSTSST